MAVIHPELPFLDFIRLHVFSLDVLSIILNQTFQSRFISNNHFTQHLIVFQLSDEFFPPGSLYLQTG